MENSSELVLDEKQAASLLGVKESVLRKIRKEEQVKPAVPHFYIGRNVRYVKKNLLDWAQSQVKKPARYKRAGDVVRVS